MILQRGWGVCFLFRVGVFVCLFGFFFGEVLWGLCLAFKGQESPLTFPIEKKIPLCEKHMSLGQMSLTC